MKRAALAGAALLLSTASNINGVNVTIIPPSQKNPQLPAADFGGLPAILLQRLYAANVFDATDWLRLTKQQRRKIFGVTAEHVAIINRATGVQP
jgi:hypothetical protein